MVAQYIATQSLLELCEGSERAPGARVRMQWWEQEGIHLVGAWEAAAMVAEEEGGEEWCGGNKEKDSWTKATAEKVKHSKTN